MPTTEWLNKYESIKDKLACKTDLEAHFTEKVIGSMGVDVLDIGTVHFPTGQIFACDPLVELEDTPPFIQTIPAGTYPVKICVVPSEKYGDRYACVKVEVSQEKPVRYELGMTGSEELDAAMRTARDPSADDSERRQAGRLFGQMQGTEFFDRLVSGSSDIAEKITGLMDYYLSPPFPTAGNAEAAAAAPYIATDAPDGLAGFDIRDFV